MKIISYEIYVERTKKPLKNISGSGILERGIKMKFRFLFFNFKIKIVKLKFDPNCPDFADDDIRVKFCSIKKTDDYDLIDVLCILKAFKNF